MTERILIVDDDVDSLKLIGLMLQRQGYDISAANSGAQALKLAEQTKPDLVILDIMMPDMDGYEVARHLRANAETAHIPIIMFTAKGTVDDKVKGFESGADDFLTKPTHPAELASRIKVLMSRSTTRAPRPGGVAETGQIISFLGVKGGVGTTTTAINSAVVMLRQLDGGSVALAELQPGKGSVGLILGFPRSSGLSDLLRKARTGLTAAAVENELVRHASGLHLLLASSTPSDEVTDLSPEAAESLVRTLATVVDYVVLDLGSNVSEVNQRLLTISKQAVLCVEPHRVAITMAQQMLEYLHELGLGPLRTNVVLVNRTPSSLQTPWQAVQQALQKDLLGIISPAPELAYQALESHSPIVQLQPDSITAGQYRKLGEDLMELVGPVAEAVSG